MIDPVDIVEGDGPVILGMPHTGLHVPAAIESRLNSRGRTLGDTDWHIERLYDGLLPAATVVRATFHRYVIDANRDPSGASFYPGRHTTGLCPLTDFDGEPIWHPGSEPDASDIEARLAAFHAPYHAALAAQVERVRARHGVAVLYDCHSIRSDIPYLFEGVLPTFNIGDADGTTCAADVTKAVNGVCVAAYQYTTVVNGRFQGGYTTRHYGRPGDGVHAIQMELSQAAYLETEHPPFAYSDTRAAALREHLGMILKRLERLALSGDLAADPERDA
jgi:formiminoglutamase